MRDDRKKMEELIPNQFKLSTVHHTQSDAWCYDSGINMPLTLICKGPIIICTPSRQQILKHLYFMHTQYTHTHTHRYIQYIYIHITNTLIFARQTSKNNLYTNKHIQMRDFTKCRENTLRTKCYEATWRTKSETIKITIWGK